MAMCGLLLVSAGCERSTVSSQVPDAGQQADEGPEGAGPESASESAVDYPKLLAALDDASTRDGAFDELERAALELGAGGGDDASRAAMRALLVQLTDEFDGVAIDPKLGEDAARGQSMRDRIRLLGRAREPSAVEPMIRALETLALPAAIHRELVTALGRIGDPRAVEALLVAPFRIPDSPSTSSIGERAIRALGAIGEPALPGVLMTLAGRHERINQLCVDQGLDVSFAQMLAVSAAAAIGSSRATGPLLELLDVGRCPVMTSESLDYDLVTNQMFAARALGDIADPAAVSDLCACAGSDQVGVAWELTFALGRIAGPEAFACLAKIVDTGRYNPDAVAAQGNEYELRWEAYRWAVLAAGPGQTGELRALRDRAIPDVQAKIDAGGYGDGIALLEDCGDAAPCYADHLADANAQIPTRELAAFRLAHLAEPGDLEAAAAIAAAFEIPDPDVRVSMAWLTRRVANHQPCAACVEALQAVMEREKGSVQAVMQRAWLTARTTIELLD